MTATRSQTHAEISTAAATRAVDRSCGDSSCGCTSTTTDEVQPGRRGLRAALLAVACAAACLGVPLVVGGAATVSALVAGDVWIAALVALVAVGGTVAMVRSRKGRPGC